MAAEAEYRQPCRRKGIHGRGLHLLPPPPPPVDWTNLPELVIDQILDGFDSPKDYLRFLLVCKTWMHHALRLWPYKKSNYERFLAPHPMLIVGDHAYSAATGKMVSTSEAGASAGGRFVWPMRPWPSTGPFYRRFTVIGSSFGWLFTHCPLRNGTFLVVLTNPQANGYLWHRYPLPSPFDGFHPSKAVLSADPSSSGTYGLAILYRKPSSEVLTRLLVLRDLQPGTPGADHQLYHTSDHVLDIARHGNNICVLEEETCEIVNPYSGGLVITTLSGITGTMQRRAKIAYLWDDTPFKMKPMPPGGVRHSSSAYLVERLPRNGGCCSVGYDNHWIVTRHRILSEPLGVVRTVGFKVFEWVHSQKDSQGSMLWRRVHELKNEAILLGRNSAFSVPAGPGLLAAGGGLEPNHIYYIDDQKLNTQKKNLVMAPDIGAFDVVQRCRKSFGFPSEYKHLLDYDVMKNQAPPLWFTIKP